MFLSCDWGTSSFRLRLINDALECVESIATKDGIANSYAAWQQAGRNESSRINFYRDILSKQITAVADKCGIELAGIPVIASGMIGSSIGLTELPYTSLPINFLTNNPAILKIPADEYFGHDLQIVSGLRTNEDVMRGEETALKGCLNDLSGNNRLFIFPGTHSKHVSVRGGVVEGIKTFMTGEIFDLLSQKSILVNSVKENKNFNDQNLRAFSNGVLKAVNENILHTAFLVRTNVLFSTYSLEENYWYLSGLLIGSELHDISPDRQDDINVVGEEEQLKLYNAALQVLAPGNSVKLVNVEDAFIKGHALIIAQES